MRGSTWPWPGTGAKFIVQGLRVNPWHDQSPWLWILVPQPSHSPSWPRCCVPFHTVIIFCFCCLFFRVSDRRCAAWGTLLHWEKLCKCLQQCRRTKVSFFLFSYISPWFSRAEPGMCCRESMSGRHTLQSRIPRWGYPCRMVLIFSGNTSPEGIVVTPKAIICLPSRPNLLFPGPISTIPSLCLEQ